MLLCSPLLIENQVECKISFLIERGMFAIHACILNDKIRWGHSLIWPTFFQKNKLPFGSFKETLNSLCTTKLTRVVKQGLVAKSQSYLLYNYL